MPSLTLMLQPALWWGWQLSDFNPIPVLVPEVARWCRESLDRPPLPRRLYLTRPDGLKVCAPVVQFQNDADLVLFKLRWL